MKILTIQRVSHTGKTFGVFKNEQDVPFALTLEREWRNNEPSISCIPAGEYLCKRVKSPKFGDTFEVTEVQGRSHILFHKGNLETDSHGCILVGEQFEPIEGNPGIAASAKGFQEFCEILKDDMEFKLIITN